MTGFVPAFVLFAAAPLAALVGPRRMAAALAGLLLAAGAACIAAAALAILATTLADPADPAATVLLVLPLIGDFGFALTPLSGLFLLITVAVFAAALPFIVRDSALYSRGRRAVFMALIVLTLAAMIGVFTAAGVVSFIVCWEIAAMAIWGLVGFETDRDEPVAAGLLTLALSELGSLAGLVGLLILALAAGTSTLAGIATAAPSLPPGIVAVACVLTFFGFGMKAGIVPLNLWLPPAHANAPRSTSPILSGATLNLGLFVFLRLDGPLALTDVRLGLMILATGAITALVGIVYALTERDLKRLLAQSSIENIGIVTAGFGAGLAFAALGKPALAGIALVAGLYHMINHSTFKTLLFLGAGGIDASAGTHDLDRLGGLMKRVPLFGTLFLLGALAIAALPPFNGFVSEWLTLESLLRVVEVASVPVRMVFALSGAALALTAGLALTCFIMLAGTSLLGIPRSAEAAAVRRMPASVTAPMAVLVVICVGLAVLATAVIPVLGGLVAPLAGTDPTSALVPAFFHGAPALPGKIAASLAPIGTQVGEGVLPLRGLAVLHSGGAATPVIFAMSTGLSFVVIAALLLLVWGLVRGFNRRGVSRARLWDAGLVRLRPEMTYNATGFSAPVRVMFNAILRPVVAHRERHLGVFVTADHYREIPTHIVARLLIQPVTAGARVLADGLARLHHGPVNAYAGYVLLALLLTLLISRVLL